MPLSQIFFSVVTIILFSSPSRCQEPSSAVREPNMVIEDDIQEPSSAVREPNMVIEDDIQERSSAVREPNMVIEDDILPTEKATTPLTSLPPSAHPPLVLVGLGATVVTALRGRDRVVVLEAGREHEQHVAAVPLPCSPDPDPVLLGAGQTVALKGSLGHLPRPCKWLFQFQETSNVIIEEFSNQTSDGYSNLTNAEYSSLTKEAYSSLINMGNSNQPSKDPSNVTDESDPNLHADDSLEAPGPAGFLELVCGELILVGKEEIDGEPDDATGKSGTNKAGGGGLADASEQFDEVKCKEGNYLVISDGQDRRERICGYLQDFTWRSETGVLRVRLRARRAGAGMGDFEMGGCIVKAM